VAALLANPANAHKDYAKIARCLFMPENVRLKEALAVVKKPRQVFSKNFFRN
jgi:hypothetical protein